MSGHAAGFGGEFLETETGLSRCWCDGGTAIAQFPRFGRDGEDVDELVGDGVGIGAWEALELVGRFEAKVVDDARGVSERGADRRMVGGHGRWGQLVNRFVDDLHDALVGDAVITYNLVPGFVFCWNSPPGLVGRLPTAIGSDGGRSLRCEKCKKATT